MAGCTSAPKKLSKDEAIRLGDFEYSKPNHDERFTTDKDFYRNNEQGIIYQDGEPLIGLTYKEVSAVTTKALEEFYTEKELRKFQKNNRNIKLELEIQNFNYDEPFVPFFIMVETAFITDRGENLHGSSSFPLEPIEKGETGTYIFSIKLDERPVKDVEKVYFRYYYVESLTGLNLRNHSNHLEFDLDVTHDIDAVDK